jgi:hypothetical protein
VRKKRGRPELIAAAFGIIVAAHPDNLRNFLLTPPAETLSFFQQLREVL